MSYLHFSGTGIDLRYPRLARVFIMVTLLFWTGTLCKAQSSQPPGKSFTSGNSRTEYHIHQSTGSIQVDGILDEEAWNTATRISLPYETYPGNNTPAAVETDCRLTYDSLYLYFGCTAYDPHPESIRAFLVDRDRTGDQDHVSLIVDPFNDARRAFDFAINPLGVQLDGLMDSQGQFNGSWDAIWESAGRITSDQRAGMNNPEINRVSLRQTERTAFLKIGYAWRP